MTERQLRALGPALSDYLDRYLFCCGHTQTFGHLNTYVRGLLSDLPRKTIEPIAQKAGTPVRTLQEFLRDHEWDRDQVSQLHQRQVASRLESIDSADDLATVGRRDETNGRNKGSKTPALQRQYLGCRGKVDNGVAT